MSLTVQPTRNVSAGASCVFLCSELQDTFASRINCITPTAIRDSSRIGCGSLSTMDSIQKVDDIKDVQTNSVPHTRTETPLFCVNYTIPDKSWWSPEYLHDHNKVEVLLKDYVNYKDKITEAYESPANREFFAGFSEFHVSHYLHETLISEGNINGSTTMVQLENYVKHQDDTKVCKKINNFKNSMDELFPNIFECVKPGSKMDFEKLTPEFIKKIHGQVMNDLIEDPGIYRKKWAKPSQESWMYLVPEIIDGNLIKLCDFVRDELKKNEHIVVARIKIVATFLCEFLQIHPFTNGNGRVARLLASWLMIDLSIVPVSLAGNSKSQKIYLQCLRDCRYLTPIRPHHLSRLILESVIFTMRMVCVSLEL